MPISYLSVNDLLNLIRELRAFPEIENYFAARAYLPHDTRRTVGGERFLYERYLLNEGGFGGWSGLGNAISESSLGADQIKRVAAKKHLLDEDARFLETVMKCLSTPFSDPEQESASRIGAPDPSQRRNYLIMQEVLCDLTLLERRALGQLRRDVGSKIVEDASGLAYRTYIDHSRDRLYIVGAAKGYDRTRTIQAAQRILVGGLAYYRKPEGVVIIERLNENFELSMIKGFSQHEEFEAWGKKLFGHVAVSQSFGSIATGPERQ